MAGAVRLARALDSIPAEAVGDLVEERVCLGSLQGMPMEDLVIDLAYDMTETPFVSRLDEALASSVRDKAGASHRREVEQRAWARTGPSQRTSPMPSKPQGRCGTSCCPMQRGSRDWARPVD